MTSPDAASPPAVKGPGFPEFVCLIASMMAINALSIDIMLPALPQIGEALGVANENSRQWVITAYLLGFGALQIVYGPLADRFGRRPLILAGLGIFAVFSVIAALAPTFETLILARIGQGMGTAATRVLAVSIVRDRYAGRQMARVMSLSFLVFLGVPIIAPTVGQGILAVAPWEAIFALLAVAAAFLIGWIFIRLPETLHPENRQPIQAGRIARAFAEAVTHRQSIGYTLAMTAITGALFAFINSSQQIFFDVFQAPHLFAGTFAVIASGIAVAAITNARLVERLGSRVIGHTALLGFIGFAAVHAAVAISGHETIWTFAVLQGLTMFCFGFLVGNFGAMAMEPMGHIAGTASSAQGFISTVLGSLTGFFIGQQFDGSAAPMTIGITACGLVALGFVLIAEKGRLFVAQNPAPVVATP